jgi:hypothetical protein
VTAVVHDHFFVEVADKTLIRVYLPPHADEPKVGQKATVAVEVWQ